MLIKVTKGSQPGPLCRYVLDPNKQKPQDRNLIEQSGIVSSVIFCPNVPGETVEELANNLQLLAKLNREVKKPVAHYSVSLHPNEAKQVERSQMVEISEAILHHLGHEYCPYFCVEHHDANQKHWHLVASTVSYDGSWVDDSFDRYRLRVLEEQLAHRFQLIPLEKTSVNKGKYLSTGEHRRKARTGETLPKEKLWNAIDNCIEPGISLERLILNLRANYPEVSIRFREENSRRVGISFAIDGIAFPGRKLGRGYSLQGLATHHGIALSEGADDALDKILAAPYERCRSIYTDLENVVPASEHSGLAQKGFSL